VESLPMGDMGYTLFLSKDLLAQQRRKAERRILEKLPLAGLDDLALASGQWRGSNVDSGYPLKFAVLFSSVPQIGLAAKKGGLAAFLPQLAEAEMKQRGLLRLSLPFIDSLKVSLSLVWNSRRARYAPYLATWTSKLHKILTMKP
jgi:DNA-binding transcriptional LysR family regulator